MNRQSCKYVDLANTAFRLEWRISFGVLCGLIGSWPHNLAIRLLINCLGTVQVLRLGCRNSYISLISYVVVTISLNGMILTHYDT